MADMTAPDTTADPCCAPEQQAACCEPTEKADCCGRGNGCGCNADAPVSQEGDVREQVRKRYVAAARAVAEHQSSGAASCGAPAVSTVDASGQPVFGGALYESAEAVQAPGSAVAESPYGRGNALGHVRGEDDDQNG
jgi:arsenite methyltransferase